MTPLAYGAALLISIPAMRHFQLDGFLAVWCIGEIAQLFYLLHLNRQLFGNEAVLDQRPVYLSPVAPGARLDCDPLAHRAHHRTMAMSRRHPWDLLTDRRQCRPSRTGYSAS